MFLFNAIRGTRYALGEVNKNASTGVSHEDKETKHTVHPGPVRDRLLGLKRQPVIAGRPGKSRYLEQRYLSCLLDR